MNTIKNKEYRKEGSSLYNCNYNVSFCTKYKRKVLDGDKQDFLKKIFNDIASKYDFNILDSTITQNQVVLVIECSPKLGIQTVITKLKNGSAKELKDTYPELMSRLPSIWTRDSYIKTLGDLDKSGIDKFLKLQKKYENYIVEE